MPRGKTIRITNKALIQEVEFKGFVIRTTNDTCKHINCGYADTFWKCASCGKQYTSYGRSSNVSNNNRGLCDNGWYSPSRIMCGGEITRIGGGKVKCKNEMFKLLGEKEIAEPGAETKFIVIGGRIEAWHTFVIDVEKVEFLPDRYSCQKKNKLVVPVKDTIVDVEIANQEEVAQTAVNIALGRK